MIEKILPMPWSFYTKILLFSIYLISHRALLKTNNSNIGKSNSNVNRNGNNSNGKFSQIKAPDLWSQAMRMYLLPLHSSKWKTHVAQKYPKHTNFIDKGDFLLLELFQSSMETTLLLITFRFESNQLINSF